jgi:hypothetical protein
MRYLGEKRGRDIEAFIVPRWPEQHAHLDEMRALLAMPTEPMPHPARREAQKGYAHKLTQPGPSDRMQVVLPALLRLQCERRIHDAWLAAAHGEGGSVGEVSATATRFASRKSKVKLVKKRRFTGYLVWLKLRGRRRRARVVAIRAETRGVA